MGPRHPYAVAVATLLVVLGAAGCDSGPSDPPAEVGLEAVVEATGLDSPVFLTAPPATASSSQDPRLFVVEQPGVVSIVEDGVVRETPFLDIRDRVISGGERGLLSLAFHPDYRATGEFFVSFTATGGHSRVERYLVSGTDPDVADPGSAELVIQVEQPFPNHNGGLIAFGPDGMLYLGLGDGGSAGDPQGHGQNLETLLGSILRIDVDGGRPYAIPPDNPFVDTPGARPEIWAYGLRNPWRFAFDPLADVLYVADVGQNQWEEINRVPADAAGINYGWNVMEAGHCYGASACDRDGLTEPIYEYSHADGCSVTGGYPFYPTELPTPEAGNYFFSDYCAGWIRSLEPTAAGGEPRVTEWDVGNLGRVTSFGLAVDGRLYVLTDDGTLYRLVSRE